MLDARPRGSKAAGLALAALCCALAFLALPALASAQAFTVNSTGDEAKFPVGATCLTVNVGECTLRAAIEAADVDSTRDSILFDSSVFTGAQGEDEIVLGSALPPIIQPVEIIDSAACGTVGSLHPCAGLTVPSGAAGLTVQATEVTVAGLAIGGGKYGINVLGGSDFEAQSNWIGFDLGASSKAVETDGIALDPTSDGAKIGGSTPLSGNVIGHVGVGVYIQGASDAKVQGNYIGTDPSGESTSGVSVGVRVVDSLGGSEATNDEIGGTLETGQDETEECDGPCNVIATSFNGTAIDLTGTDGVDEPASGPTTIRGNYIALSADGTGAIYGTLYGVKAASQGGTGDVGPSGVTIGGVAPSQSNFFIGDEYGIYMEKAEKFTAAGNRIGVLPDGEEGAGPSQVGIFLFGLGVTEKATVLRNRIELGPGPVAIESRFEGSNIELNFIKGGFAGIVTRGSNEGAGNLIKDNSMERTYVYGIQILNQDNVVGGNFVNGTYRSAVRLEGEADGNLIGGDTAFDQNSLNNAGENAIEIDGEESIRNEIAGNQGSGNGGRFITLNGDNLGEIPNGGIEPPIVFAGTVTATSAEGTAEPGATVRIFRKESNDPGDVEAFIGETTADGSGHWAKSFGSFPADKFLAATQTKEGGTSELSNVVKLPGTPIPPSPTPSGGGSTPPPPVPLPVPVAPVATAPSVKLTKKPAKSSAATIAKFRFTASPVAGARFECKLDKSKFARCRSPKTYGELKPGKHTFQVRAVGPTGLESTAARFKFQVLG